MSWTPKWSEPEKAILENLRMRIRIQKAELESMLKLYPDVSGKWDWPSEAMDIVRDARLDASKNKELLTNDLNKILEWPTPAMARKDFFYNAEGPNSMFDRSKDWFQEEGFTAHETTYTFSDTWDKAEIKATILVPKNLPAGHKAPVMWFFHGGGFCTGAADFVPWYSGSAVRRAKEKGAIIIAPNYCLGPEGNYQDISNSIKDFLASYDKEGCFKPGCKKWTDWVYKQESKQNFTIDKKHLYVEGESAGGHAAVTAMWLNAAKDGPHLPIDVALLRYPMIAHYSRSWPEKTKENPQGLVPYMGENYERTFVEASAKDVEAIIMELEEWGIVPTCTARPPPRGMAFAVRLSLTQTWQQYFQRLHGKKLGRPVDPQDETLMDGVERAENCADRVIPKFLPPIHIYHGYDDTNCKPQDTERFVQALRNPQLYGKRFEGNDMLFFEQVYELKTKRVWDNKNKVLKCEKSGAVGHGFDYYLQEQDEEFLQRAYERVARLWAPGA